MIRRCARSDFEPIHEIINDAAQAYRGFIPPDRWHEPYMSTDELSNEIRDGVIFWGAERGRELVAVMGIQDKGEVTLIRHAYVRTQIQGEGIGTTLLRHLEAMTEQPILIGTWAVSFYRKNGYTLVTKEEKNLLLRRYWHIPDRQVETSVVLAKPSEAEGYLCAFEKGWGDE